MAQLEARLWQEFELLNLPAKAWSIPRRHGPWPMLDVAIVGGGMTGLCAAVALWMVGLSNVAIFDRASAGREGPWMTFARMETLRTAKEAMGPALGVPSLTYRAWYEAIHGTEHWREMDRASRESWMDYLIWYRRVLKLDVRNEITVADIRPLDEGLIELAVEDKNGASSPIFARRVILANGFDGYGAPVIPSLFGRLDRRFWAHSSHEINFRALSGRRVGIVGIGASAVDNAATALEAGAKSVDIFVRRAAIPAIQKYGGVSGAGILHGFATLPDEWKLRFTEYEEQEQNPAPRRIPPVRAALRAEGERRKS